MWKQLLNFGKQIISLTRKTQEHDADIKEIRQELRALSETLQQMQFEQRHDRDMAARDRENLLLRLENYLLRSERGLPPGGPESPLQTRSSEE